MDPSRGRGGRRPPHPAGGQRPSLTCHCWSWSGHARASVSCHGAWEGVSQLQGNGRTVSRSPGGLVCGNSWTPLTAELPEHQFHVLSSLPREPAAARLWQVKSPWCYLAPPTWLPAPLRLFHRHVGVRIGVGVRLGHVHGCVSHFRVRVHFGIRIGARLHFLQAQSGVGWGEQKQLLPPAQRHGAQPRHRHTSEVSSRSGPPAARSRAHPDPASPPAGEPPPPPGAARSQVPRPQGRPEEPEAATRGPSHSGGAFTFFFLPPAGILRGALATGFFSGVKSWRKTRILNGEQPHGGEASPFPQAQCHCPPRRRRSSRSPHHPASLHASAAPNLLTWSLFFSDSEDVSEFSSSVREGLP